MTWSGSSPAVVVHVHQSGPVSPPGGGQPSGTGSGRPEIDPDNRVLRDKVLGGDPVPRPGTLDPFRSAAEFPGLWQAYIRGNFRSIAQVIAAFGVSERAARKWWDGEGGARGHYVAMACRMHPETAPRMLFAA